MLRMQTSMNAKMMTTSCYVVAMRCVRTRSARSSVHRALTVDLATSLMSPPAAVTVGNKQCDVEGFRSVTVLWEKAPPL